MVAYNFKTQFAPLVEQRVKRCTIRAKGKRRHATAGEFLQLYTGMRSPLCRKLLIPDPVCLSAEPLAISVDDKVFTGHGNEIQLLTDEQVHELAIADGFESVDAFFEFFRTTHGFPFLGVLIKW